MKKQYRDIIVNGQTYGWNVTDNDWNNYLKIWIKDSDNKNRILIYEGNCSSDEIKPSHVKEIILGL
jgi:hypothetical protein